MIHSMLKAGALALGSVAFAVPAFADTSLPHGAPFIVLAQDEENKEVWQDLRPDITPPEAAVGKKEETPNVPSVETPMQKGSGDMENQELWHDMETGVTPPPNE